MTHLLRRRAAQWQIWPKRGRPGLRTRTVGELAAATATRPELLRRLLRALASRGVFAEESDGRFALSELAEPSAQRRARWLGPRLRSVPWSAIRPAAVGGADREPADWAAWLRPGLPSEAFRLPRREPGGRGGLLAAAVPPGGDAYILKRTLHDWDDDRAASVLCNCRDAMNEGGRILIADPVAAQHHRGRETLIDRTRVRARPLYFRRSATSTRLDLPPVLGLRHPRGVERKVPIPPRPRRHRMPA
jgi:hypothetical protein